MKRAYVTGATGCLGRNLVEELLKEKWEVVVLHRASSDLSRLAGCNVKFKEVDLHDPKSVIQSLEPGFDAIFHVAGNTSHWAKDADEQWRDNVLATRNLVAAALARKIRRFIFTSTGATLSFQGDDEIRANKIRNGYIRTKRLAELEVYNGVERGLDAVILHPIIVIGRYDYNSYAQIFANMKTNPIRVAFPGRIAFCHALDVAKAHIAAFENGRPCERYVLGGTYATWLEAFTLICKMLRVPGPVVLPRWILMVVSYFMVSISWVTGKKPLLTPDLAFLLKDAPDVTFYEKRKAALDLGYQSRSLEVMVNDCFQWLYPPEDNPIELGRVVGSDSSTYLGSRLTSSN